MGKIRIKTLGIEELEKEQKKEAKKRKEKKIAAKAPGLKGVPAEGQVEERVAAAGPSLEELEKVTKKEAVKPVKKEKVKARPSRKRSARYKSAKVLVEKRLLPISEALELLGKLQKAKFDETVELHINTIETGISGNLVLPHGTGKKTKVAIANDKLVESVEKGRIDFDVLIATPEMMPKLAKVAKFLGPRGLMPNPKNGTITSDPEGLIKKYENGQISFRTETKAPIIHLVVGKMSFGNKKLLENIKTVLNAIQASKIKNITLKSTMSPGIKIDLTNIEKATPQIR